MPIFKARQEQPLGIASSSSSIPPSQFYSTGVSLTLSPTRCPSSLVEHYTLTKPSKPKADAFVWSRLPQHIRQDILAHALLPDGPDTPIIIGLPEHRAHLNTTALPIFLALGSWEAYVNAASIFYQHVHLHLALFQESSGVFLTSPSTLRPRSLVVRMQLHFTIRKYMILFDTGYTISESMRKLIKMNIPTALRSLRTHGRLEDVHLVILKGPRAVTEDWGESAVPGHYFPLAKMQLGFLASPAESDGLLGPAEVVVAPAFLGSRAFQAGFLSLLEDGVFENMKLSLQSCADAEGDTLEDYKSITSHEVDRDAFVQCWLGATVLELLLIIPADYTWADPFPLIPKCDGMADETMVDFSELQASQDHPGFNPLQKTRYDLMSSPIRYPTSSSGSDTDSSSGIVINLDALCDDTHHEEESANRTEPELSDNDASSEASSSSEQAVQEFHKYFGATRDELDSTDPAGASNGFENTKAKIPSLSSDAPPKDSTPIPAVRCLDFARVELITTLSDAAARNDTMESIAMAAADRQLSSYGVLRGATSTGPCTHDDPMLECATPSDAVDNVPRTPAGNVPLASSQTSSVVPDEMMSVPLFAGGSTALHRDDEADSDPDTDTNTDTSSSSGDESDHDVSPEDLSYIENVFGARAGDETRLDVHGGSNPTNCILVLGSEKAERHPGKGKRAERPVSVDLSLDGETSKSDSAKPTAKPEAQANTKPAKTDNPKKTARKLLTPQSAHSKGPVKVKPTQTPGLPKKPVKTNHTPAKKAKPAVATDNNHVSKKRKDPPAASDAPSQEPKSKRRRRARAAKKQLQSA